MGRAKYKYKPGDRIGPYQIELLERLDNIKVSGYQYFALFKCPNCGSPYQAKINHISRGLKKQCPSCSKQGKLNLKNKIFFNSVKAIEPTEKREKDGSVIWKCECLWCHKIFYTSGSRLTGGTISSCGCSSGSLGERIVHRTLTEVGIPFIREYAFKDFLKEKRQYRFDFFVNNSYVIEVDSFLHEEEERIKDDNIKNQYCHQHNIPIIRIPGSHLKDICLEDLLLETSNFIVEKSNNGNSNDSF